MRDSSVRGRRSRLLVGAVALGAAALGLSSCGFPATAASTDVAPSGTRVVQCSSGTVTQGAVQMSALFVARVPAGVLGGLPGGCTVPTG